MLLTVLLPIPCDILPVYHHVLPVQFDGEYSCSESWVRLPPAVRALPVKVQDAG